MRAVKLEPQPCLACDYEVVYRGPWKEVLDDEGHTFRRGERAHLCERTHGLLTDPEGPYAGKVISVTEPGKAPLTAAREACAPADSDKGCC